MKRRVSLAWLTAVVLCVSLMASNAVAQLGGANLLQQLGGSDMLAKLSKGFLESAAKDPRLAGLLGKVDLGGVTPKLTDQMCAMLGGSCKAPLTEQQIAAGEKKLQPEEKQALSDNFSSALGSVVNNPLAKQGVNAVVGPKLGGIVGALI